MVVEVLDVYLAVPINFHSWRNLRVLSHCKGSVFTFPLPVHYREKEDILLLSSLGNNLAILFDDTAMHCSTSLTHKRDQSGDPWHLISDYVVPATMHASVPDIQANFLDPI